MTLKKLKKIIHSELRIIDHSCNKHYYPVDCHGSVFEELQEKEVIGIRATDDVVVVSIK